MGVVTNPLKYLALVWIGLIVLLLLFKFNNWVDDRTPKKKEDKPKKAKEETIKKIEEKTSDSLSVVKEKEPEKKEIKKEEVFVNTNYLYDRFVDNPTNDDSIEDKKNNAFLSVEESDEIKNKKVEIKVKPVENLSQKEALYKKIEQMTSTNAEEKEKMLEEFEALPRTTKLMLIENIIQKMN